MAQLSDHTVLIVDDTPTNLEVLSTALIKADYKVAVALDGENAITQIQYKPPTLILLDVMMPGIDGFETCQRLKADPKTKHIPIIFMTALTETVNKAKGFSLGAVDYITKPFEAEEVLARVNTHLRLSQLTTGLEQAVAKRTAELTAALDHLQQAQAQLIYSERMSLIGELSAGVAYEISNPVNFIRGNLRHIDTYATQLLQLVDYYYSKPQQQPGQPIAETASPLSEVLSDLDLDFIREDLPKILSSFQRGTDRIQKLVSDLRTFAESDQVGRKSANIHDLIEGCLTLIGHKLQEKTHRPAIQVLKDYQQTPSLEGYPAALSQALMGILLIYIDRLEGVRDKDPGFSPKISIQLGCKSQGWLTIRLAINLEQVFSDNASLAISLERSASGIYSESLSQPADLNLLMAHDIVANMHGGNLHLQVKSGQTEITFELRETLDIAPLIKPDTAEKRGVGEGVLW